MESLSAAVSASMPRQLGRYQIIETLGHGGMGTIQLAVVGGLGQFRKLVVLKVLREPLASDERFVDMFMREAALAARLSHPNVVQTVEASQVDGLYFLVMEFLDGQPLNKLLRAAAREPAVPLGLRLQILSSALLGLHHAHELSDYDGRPLQLVHRDVSPSNVFITYDGQVKLLDFGIAEARDSEESAPGVFKGKLGYAAPEQLRGLPSDRRSDVFAAGVVLWETIALRQLSPRDRARETIAARLAGSEPRIAKVVPGVDPELAAICDRALMNDPSERYQTAAALQTALQAFLSSRGLACEPHEIGTLLRSKFARARAILHGVIEAAMRASAEDDESRVVAVHPEPVRAELSRVFDPQTSAPLPPPPASNLTRWVGLGVLAVVVAVATNLALRKPAPPPAVVTPRAPEVVAPPAALPFGLEPPPVLATERPAPQARRTAARRKVQLAPSEEPRPAVAPSPPERDALDSLDLRDIRRERRPSADLVNPFQ